MHFFETFILVGMDGMDGIVVLGADAAMTRVKV